MAGDVFSLIPREVKTVDTPWRRMAGKFPVPASVPILEQLRQFEPASMAGQPPVVWDRAQGCQVHDAWGNTWLDFSSGVLVANVGHSHPRVQAAAREQIDRQLMHSYCFATDIRARLVEALADVAPAGLDKVFLLTTGSEATECAIKLMRARGLAVGGERKIGIVSFRHGFHGRTWGAQMAGGVPALKRWIVHLDPAMVQVPFPDGFRQSDTSFDVFENTLAEAGIEPDQVAGVMMETYQGGSAAFAPPAYLQKLRAWCDAHDVVLTFDEVQAGFGRTGRMWGFEHYDVTPDLICCGKGISSGLPLSAVIGRAKLLNQFPPGSMTSTHTGNPVCAAAALASLQVLQDERLVDHAARLGELLLAELQRIQKRFGPAATNPVGAADARGLVATVQMVRPGTTEPNAKLAGDIVRRCVEAGLLMFAPVGVGGGTIKICPPLVIDEPALREGLGVLERSMEQAIAATEETAA